MAGVAPTAPQLTELCLVSRWNAARGYSDGRRGCSVATPVSATPRKSKTDRKKFPSSSSPKNDDKASEVETASFEEGVFDTSSFWTVNDNLHPQSEAVQGTPDEDTSSRTLNKESLIPDEWKHMQVHLHMTKREKKTQFAMQQRENAQLNELRAELQRQRIDLLSETEESAHSQSLAGSNRLLTPSQLKEFERESSIKPADPRFLDREFEEMFTFKERGLLRRMNPDFSQVYCQKWPLLHMLASSGQYFFLELFLDLGVEVDEQDEDGYTPLQRAVQARRDTAVTQLLSAGANVHILDKDGASLLHSSAQVNSLHLVKLFVIRGLDVNHIDKAGWTPLHVAALTGRDDIVRHLILSGADQSIINEDGMTAMDIAMALGKELNSARVVRTLKRLFSVDLLV